MAAADALRADATKSLVTPVDPASGRKDTTGLEKEKARIIQFLEDRGKEAESHDSFGDGRLPGHSIDDEFVVGNFPKSASTRIEMATAPSYHPSRGGGRSGGGSKQAQAQDKASLGRKRGTTDATRVSPSRSMPPELFVEKLAEVEYALGEQDDATDDESEGAKSAHEGKHGSHAYVAGRQKELKFLMSVMELDGASGANGGGAPKVSASAPLPQPEDEEKTRVDSDEGDLGVATGTYESLLGVVKKPVSQKKFPPANRIHLGRIELPKPVWTCTATDSTSATSMSSSASRTGVQLESISSSASKYLNRTLFVSRQNEILTTILTCVFLFLLSLRDTIIV